MADDKKMEKMVAPMPAAGAAAAASLEAMLAEKEALEKKIAEAKKAAATLPYKGRRLYMVGSEKAFWGGRLYEAGEQIELVDEVPSKTWTLLAIDGKPVNDAVMAKPIGNVVANAVVAGKRPSDMGI